MQTHRDTDHRVLEVIVRSPGNTLDDIVLECSDLTWNQVFSAIDRLSREGTLTLTPKGQGLYTIRLSNQGLQEAITTPRLTHSLVREPIRIPPTCAGSMSSMKTQTSKQAAEKKPQAPLAHQSTETVAPRKSARQARPSFDDLHARITTRAYELYVERGSRDGCAFEDWLDAEREIVNREFPALRACAYDGMTGRLGSA